MYPIEDIRSGTREHLNVIFSHWALWKTRKQKFAATWQNQQNGCAPSEDSDQPGHPPSLIRVFAVRMEKAWVLSYTLSAQRRLWSDWADAQTDLRLRLAYTHFVGFVMWWFKWTAMIRRSNSAPCFMTPNRKQSDTLCDGCKWASSRENLSSGFATRVDLNRPAQPQKLGFLAIHWAHSEDSDQTGWTPRLIWVFAERTVILLVLSWRGSNKHFNFAFKCSE